MSPAARLASPGTGDSSPVRVGTADPPVPDGGSGDGGPDRGKWLQRALFGFGALLFVVGVAVSTGLPWPGPFDLDATDVPPSDDPPPEATATPTEGGQSGSTPTDAPPASPNGTASSTPMLTPTPTPPPTATSTPTETEDDGGGLFDWGDDNTPTPTPTPRSTTTESPPPTTDGTATPTATSAPSPSPSPAPSPSPTATGPTQTTSTSGTAAFVTALPDLHVSRWLEPVRAAWSTVADRLGSW